MTIKSTNTDDGKNLTIDIRGRFDFSVQQAFRAAYQLPSPALETYRVNLSQVSDMDSAALGMLNLLRKKANQESNRVVLVKPSSQAKKILLAARFDALFTIEE